MTILDYFDANTLALIEILLETNNTGLLIDWLNYGVHAGHYSQESEQCDINVTLLLQEIHNHFEAIQ